MGKVDIKVVREKCNVMNDAWVEGAAAVDFNGIMQVQFLADITAAAADAAEIGVAAPPLYVRNGSAFPGVRKMIRGSAAACGSK